MNRGSAIIFPASSIKFGQSKESCSPMAVPDTTPIATVTAKPRAQRLAIRI